VNPELPEEAVEFAAAAAKAMAALGGVDLARRAEADPSVRHRDVAPILAALGIDELDPRADADALAASAALCEQAGRVALPYPLPAVLLADDAGRPYAAVAATDGTVRADHADLFPEWRVGTLDGPVRLARPTGHRLATRLGPFVGDLALAEDTAEDARGGSAASDAIDLAHHVVLTTCAVLGTADRAVELAVAHVSNRVQFGKPISAFQAVQFQLADAAVAVAGLRELAHFTVWRLGIRAEGLVADVLALRLHALDVARAVLRTTQQLHGAAGVCDEYDVSVLARHVQPALRLPWSAERTADELAAAVHRHGFEGLFAHGLAALR
jgi:acyl-CoA dehydrogenase